MVLLGPCVRKEPPPLIIRTDQRPPMWHLVQCKLQGRCWDPQSAPRGS